MIPAAPARLFPAFLVAVACTLVVALSILPPSSTRIQAWPWAGFAAVGWLMPITIALYRLAFSRAHSRLGGFLDAGVALLACGATASALASPLRGAVLPHLLPFLGACAFPYSLLPALQISTIGRTCRVSGGMLAFILLVSLLLWLEPWAGFIGLGSRNAQPFGHANITGSVAVLAATWFALGAARETGRARLLFAFGAVLAIVTALSSESRGAVIALAAAGGTAAAIVLIQRGRLLTFIAIAALLATSTIASNARLRDLVVHGRWSAAARESNDQRTAMLLGGFRLGAERPLLGWGAGSVPHVFPRVRADLPGTADNVLQLHNTPVQLWATLGTAGLLAGLLIAAGLASRLRVVSWTHDRIALASGLVGTATVLLFDHPFATPLFAVLAAAHLAAWASSTRNPDSGFPHSNLPARTPGLWPRASALLLSLLLIPTLLATARDLRARSAHSAALDYASDNNPSGYAEALRRAIRISPGDPFYAHQLAAHLATGHPFPTGIATDSAAAIPLLQSTLSTNPDLEYAHYNLGWLLLDRDPAAAADHFLNAARLAPQRGAVYWGLGLARIRLEDTRGAARAFATEWLLNPSFAWSPFWYEPPLDALRPRIRALASEAMRVHGVDPWRSASAPAAYGPAYRRLRTGYGVLMGHPEGPPPVDINIQHRLLLPEHVTRELSSVPAFSGRELLDFLNTPDSP